MLFRSLHRFLKGDENSASDTKTMLDACNALIKEFDCTVLLVHHTGVSEEAQHRARGSSAWRAALDIEISVVPAKDDTPMQIVQRKSKDAELAPTQTVELQQVTIPGWVDEDGEPVTSAIIVKSDKPPQPSKEENKLNQHRHLFESGWWATGAKVSDGFPYVVRAEMHGYLVSDKGYTDATATKYLKAGNPGLLITDLKGAGIIRDHADGWVVIDEKNVDAMLLARGT